MPTFDELRLKWENKDAEDSVVAHETAMKGILELTGLSTGEANKFFNLNEKFLRKELVAYGFSLDNPFIIFLSLFLKSGLDHKIFCEVDGNWGIVHNLVANRILTIQQLTFKTAKEEDKPMLLLNPSFWGSKIPLGDRTWVIQFWIWCGSKEINSEIVNTACRLLLSSPKDIIPKDILNLSSNITEDNYVKIYNAINKGYVSLVDTATKADLTAPSIITKIRKYFMATFRAVTDIENLNTNLDILAKTLTETPQNAKPDDILKITTSNIELVKNKIEAFNNVAYIINDVETTIEKMDSFVKMELVTPTQMSTSVAKSGEKTDLSNRDTLSKEYKRREGREGKETTNKRQTATNTNNKVSWSEYQQALKNVNAKTKLDLSKLKDLPAPEIRSLSNDLSKIVSYLNNII